MERLSELLATILTHHWPKNELPLVYYDETSNEETPYQILDYEQDLSNINSSPNKRSRYYRKYPWKRQNSRQT